ncbi:uncharacterized protein isoform X2 [Choristoneura fumiferana]|uniref:uncharacterized protein isoform X1 n=1 Tax=Choristoneura fumiferana TaxID=7141 RepID=UPI003D1571DF
MQIISLLSCVISLAVHIGALCVPCDAAQWPDVANDPVIYVNNPIEADLPSHWVPLSILKQVVHMRGLKKLTEPQYREVLNYKKVKIKPAEYDGKKYSWGKKGSTPQKKTRTPSVRKVSNRITNRVTSRPYAISSAWSPTSLVSNIHTTASSSHSATLLNSEAESTTVDTGQVNVVNHTTEPANSDPDESAAVSSFATISSPRIFDSSPTTIASIFTKNDDTLTITTPTTSTFTSTTTIPDIPSPVSTSALITSALTTPLPTSTSSASTSTFATSATTSTFATSATTSTTTPTTTAKNINTKRKKIKTKASLTTSTKSTKKSKETTTEGTGDPFYRL